MAASDLFDAAVLALSSPIDTSDAALLPEEHALVAGAAPRRRLEFATGRRCARTLLAQLGRDSAPLLRHPDRTPAWPDAVVGSISHCAVRCVVALAPRSAAAGIGIDVEPDAPLDERLWARICTPRELDRTLRALPPHERGRTVRLLFSAKEALYKAIHPLLREPMGFQGAEIEIDWDTCRVVTRLAPGVLRRLPGGRPPAARFERGAGLILVGATLPPAD
jgi:4'-phosphopantetheinyl transferase EntD